MLVVVTLLNPLKTKIKENRKIAWVISMCISVISSTLITIHVYKSIYFRFFCVFFSRFHFHLFYIVTAVELALVYFLFALLHFRKYKVVSPFCEHTHLHTHTRTDFYINLYIFFVYL